MHDLHFLERLSRVSWRETERALGLYRAPDLVRFLLDSADLGAVERVALALGDGDDGPWAVVARDGGFVTCLAAGMDLDGLPHLSRAHMTRQIARHDRLRERAARWEVTDSGEVEAAISSLFTRAERVPAETMILLAPFTPLFAGKLFELAGEVQRQVDDAVRLQGARLRRVAARLRPADVELVRALWRAAWAGGHCFALLGELDSDALHALGEADEAAEITAPTIAAGLLPAVMRASWFAARLGPGLLRSCRALAARTVDAGHPHDAVAYLQAAAVGLATAGARAEAAALVAPPADAAPSPTTALRAALAAQLAAPADAPSALGPLALRARINATTAVWGGSHPARAGLPELLAALVGQPLATLYPTREALAAAPSSWRARDAAKALTAAPTGDGPAPWAPAEGAKVGRNAPCPCGSGKKYKRCCGA